MVRQTPSRGGPVLIPRPEVANPDAKRCRPQCVVVTEVGSYLRLIDSCITHLKAQGFLEPVTRVKKKKKTPIPDCPFRFTGGGHEGAVLYHEFGYAPLLSLLLSSLELSDTNVYEP